MPGTLQWSHGPSAVEHAGEGHEGGEGRPHFNGATALRPWNTWCPWPQPSPQQHGTSMEPRPFGRGTRHVCRQTRGRGLYFNGATALRPWNTWPDGTVPTLTTTAL